MINYQPPGTTVNIVDNTRIINLGAQQRLVAIVGLGPMQRTVVDEAIIRSTGSIDYFSAYPTTGFLVSQISDSPGIIPNSISAVPRSLNGNLYSLSSASVNTTGYVSWPQGGSNIDIPATGSTYYVRYTYDVPPSQFNPNTYSDKQLIEATYTTENNNTGILTIAGSLILENGCPAVTIVQASGSSYTEASYKTAIDKLQKKTNIEQIIAVFPSGSVTRTQQESLQLYLISHIQSMNNLGKERGIVIGSPSAYFASSGGFDVIGDDSTNPSYVYRAKALRSQDIIYAIPSGRVQRADNNGVYMELDGNFIAAALAGKQLAQTKLSTPIHGFTITGLVLEDEKWNDTEMNQAGAGNCTVVQSIGGVVTVRDYITTDGTSADTQEPSVVSVKRLVKRSLRDSLKNTFTNKGKVITPETPRAVEATAAATLQTLVNDGEIYAYGQTDNPLTGETKIFAKQNILEPRQIDLTCSYKSLYPFKWISVTVSLFV